MFNSSDEGEIWFRCEECGVEQEEDCACVECGCHGMVPFTKPYPVVEPSEAAHHSLRIKLNAALKKRDLKDRLDSLIEMMQSLTEEEKVIFCHAMSCGLLTIGIALNAATTAIQRFAEDMRKSSLTMEEAAANWRINMRRLSEIER